MKRIILCLLAAILLCGILAGCGEIEKEASSSFTASIPSSISVSSAAENSDNKSSSSSEAEEIYYYDMIAENGITETQFHNILKGMPYDLVMTFLGADVNPKPTENKFYCQWKSPTTDAVVRLCFLDDELYVKVGASLTDDESYVPTPHSDDLTDEQLSADDRKTMLPYKSYLSEELGSIFDSLDIADELEYTGFEYREDMSMPENDLYEYYLFFKAEEKEVVIQAMELDKTWTVIDMRDVDTEHYYYMMPSLEDACDIYDFHSGELIKEATTTMSELAGK